MPVDPNFIESRRRIARRLSVCERTVSRMVADGRLPVRREPNGRIKAATVALDRLRFALDLEAQIKAIDFNVRRSQESR